MKYIPLTQNHFALVDDVDYEALVAIGRWSYSDGYAVNYSKDQLGKRKTLYMHRLVMDRILGYPVGNLQVDHISGAKLGKAARSDNRRENLQLATRTQNQAHKGKGVNNTSNYRGVSRNGKKWETRIRYADKRINLGRFDDAVTAAQMYDAASVRLYKEFAGRNFPDELTPSHIDDKIDTILAGYGLLSPLIVDEPKSSRVMILESENPDFPQNHMKTRIIQSKSILTKQEHGFLSTGQFPFTHTLNAYTGCSFGNTACGSYCYAPSLPNWTNADILTDVKWGEHVFIKKNAAEVLAETLASMKPDTRQGLRIFMSPATDPYQPLESQHQITRAILEVFSRYSDLGLLVIQTRSDLVKRDFDLISKLPYAWLSMTVETDDETILRELAPVGIDHRHV